jgi:hypothetical protein
MKSCKDCKFYKLPMMHEGKEYAFCFRPPPTALAENKSTSPLIAAERPICGEFRRKGWFKK